MSKLQKWLIVLAVWVLALGVLLSQMSKRFVVEPYALHTRDGIILTSGFNKTDTWTGRVFQKMTVPEPEKEGWIEIK